MKVNGNVCITVIILPEIVEQLWATYTYIGDGVIVGVLVGVGVLVAVCVGV
jgi:hypothetical protein